MKNGKAERSPVGKIRGLFWTAFGFFLLHAVTIALMMPMAIATIHSENTFGAFLIGITFWMSLLVGWALLLLANLVRRDWFRREKLDLSMNQRIGAITFFSSIPAACSDSVAAASLVALGVLALLGEWNAPFTGVMLAILSFSLNAHGLFNGRIYMSTKIQTYKERET